METIDRLLEKSCYVIDFIPTQVARESKGDFFEVEKYLLNHATHHGLLERYINIILKLMCYYQILVFRDGVWIQQPGVDAVIEFVEETIQNSSDVLNILFSEEDALLVVEGDCLHMTIYNPDEEMCILLKDIVVSEGMFLRKSMEKGRV